jgi:hypothetical protein
MQDMPVSLFYDHYHFIADMRPSVHCVLVDHSSTLRRHAEANFSVSSHISFTLRQNHYMDNTGQVPQMGNKKHFCIYAARRHRCSEEDKRTSPTHY